MNLLKPFVQLFAEAKPKLSERTEVATTRDGRDITRGWIMPDMPLPPQDSIQRLKGGDLDIYADVMLDDQVQSCFQQRRLAVIAREWQVEAGGDKRIDKQAADFIRATLDNIRFDNLTDKMLYGRMYGFAVAECLWGRDGSQVTLDDIKVRDRRRFIFDGDMRLRLRTTTTPLGELLPERKFWVFSTGSDHDDEPYGLGLAHWLYWPVFFKKNGLRFWLIFLEKFGSPAAVGKFPPGTSEADQALLLSAVQAIQTDSGLTIPEGMVIELLQATRQGSADYSELYDKLQGVIAKVILSQTATTEGTAGSLGSEQERAQVADTLIKADADLVCNSFTNQVVRWLVEWNYPNAAIPRVWRVMEWPENLNKRAERDLQVVQMGYRPTLKHIVDTYGGEWVELNGIESQPQDFAETRSLPGKPVAPDKLIEQLGKQAEPVIQDMLNPIRDLLESVDSLEEFRDSLADLFPDMDKEVLAGLLRGATLTAELAGRFDVEKGR